MVALSLTTSACVGRDSSVNPESITAMGVRAIVEVRPTQAYVSPDGSAWIYEGQNELCVGRHAAPDAAPMCARWDRSFSSIGVSWSSNSNRVVFTQDFYTRLDEPDVAVFDIETGRIDVLTDDSIDDPRDDAADIDILPFFGPGDQIYFIRYGTDQTLSLYRVVDGGAVPVGGGQLGDRLLSGVPIQSGDNTWTFPDVETAPDVAYRSITFDGSRPDATVSVNDVWAPDDETARLADAANGRLLLTRPNERSGNNAALVVSPGERSSVELPVDQTFSGGFSMSGAQLSPDGRYVLEVRSNGGGDAKFTVWRLDADGAETTAEPLEAGTVTDERIGGGFGLLPGTLGWDGGTTITAVGSAGVVVFDVTDER